MAIEVGRDLAPVFHLCIEDFFAEFVGKFLGESVELTSATDVLIRVNFDIAIHSESRQGVTVDSLQRRAIILAHSLVHLLLNLKGQTIF